MLGAQMEGRIDNWMGATAAGVWLHTDIRGLKIEAYAVEQVRRVTLAVRIQFSQSKLTVYDILRSCDATGSKEC